MHRRSFLKTTVVGASAVGAGSCAHLDLGSLLSATTADVVAMVNQLRARLDFIASPAAREALVAAGEAPAADDHLFRDGAQTLVLAGAFHSMPEDVRAHPAVQQLMGEKLAMMSSTTQRLHQVALATTPEERTELTKRLREDPSVLDDAAQRLDLEASQLGLSGELRLRLRGLFVQVGSRMKQSTSLAFEEYSRKVARIEARMAEPRAFEREYVARLGDQAFWDFQARQNGYAAAWASQPAAPAPADEPPPQARGRAVSTSSSADMGDDSWARPRVVNDGSVAIPVGATMLGLGLALGIGGVFMIVSVGSSLLTVVTPLIVVTVGVLLLAAGLITLIVGSARRRRALNPQRSRR